MKQEKQSLIINDAMRSTMDLGCGFDASQIRKDVASLNGEDRQTAAKAYLSNINGMFTEMDVARFYGEVTSKELVELTQHLAIVITPAEGAKNG